VRTNAMAGRAIKFGPFRLLPFQGLPATERTGRILRATVAAAILSSAAFGAFAGEANRVEARFEMFGILGLHVLTNRTSVVESADRYSIAMNLDTRGLARLFHDLTSHSEVHGWIGEDQVRPQWYRSWLHLNGVDRYYGVDYLGDGAVADRSTPLPYGGPQSISAEEIRGTVDQLTAYFLLARQLAQGGRCASIMRVFDGAAVYDIRFTDSKPEMLTPDGRQDFAGNTKVYEVLRQENHVKRGEGVETYQRGRIWYARLTAGDLMLPVRMEFGTGFGSVTGYLAEVRGDGVQLRLMPE
jgi:Protein of unknown function (DUF3108)